MPRRPKFTPEQITAAYRKAYGTEAVGSKMAGRVLDFIARGQRAHAAADAIIAAEIERLKSDTTGERIVVDAPGTGDAIVRRAIAAAPVRVKAERRRTTRPKGHA